MRSRVGRRKRKQRDEKDGDRDYSHSPSTVLLLMRSGMSIARAYIRGLASPSVETVSRQDRVDCLGARTQQSNNLRARGSGIAEAERVFRGRVVPLTLFPIERSPAPPQRGFFVANHPAR